MRQSDNNNNNNNNTYCTTTHTQSALLSVCDNTYISPNIFTSLPFFFHFPPLSDVLSSQFKSLHFTAIFVIVIMSRHWTFYSIALILLPFSMYPRVISQTDIRDVYFVRPCYMSCLRCPWCDFCVLYMTQSIAKLHIFLKYSVISRLPKKIQIILFMLNSLG